MIIDQMVRRPIVKFFMYEKTIIFYENKILFLKRFHIMKHNLIFYFVVILVFNKIPSHPIVIEAFSFFDCESKTIIP